MTRVPDAQTLSLTFELSHPPEKVWRALTDSELLAEWLLPVCDLTLEPGAAFTFKAQPQPGWDGIVNCRLLEIEAQRKLSWTWVVGQSHRWLSIAFTLTVIANFAALAASKGQQPPDVVTYSPLLPLFLLMFSGLYLFALPYTAKGRSAKMSGP